MPLLSFPSSGRYLEQEQTHGPRDGSHIESNKTALTTWTVNSWTNALKQSYLTQRVLQFLSYNTLACTQNSSVHLQDYIFSCFPCQLFGHFFCFTYMLFLFFFAKKFSYPWFSLPLLSLLYIILGSMALNSTYILIICVEYFFSKLH